MPSKGKEKYRTHLWLDIALGCLLGLLIFFLAGITFSKAAPSGRVTLTRPSAKSVDGFGGIRGYDYSHAPTIRGTKMPLPVSLRVRRKQTSTYGG